MNVVNSKHSQLSRRVISFQGKIIILEEFQMPFEYRGVEAGLSVGANVPIFFEIVRVLEILMLHWKIFRLLLLVKIKVTNFIENSSNLAPSFYRCHGALASKDTLNSGTFEGVEVLA